MNKGLLVLNIVLLLAVGALYILFFTEKKSAGETVVKRPGLDTSGAAMHTPVAYCEMDSIEANFIGFKQMEDEVLRKEQIRNDSINMLRDNFQKYVLTVQPLFQKMNSAEKDSLNSEVMKLDNYTKIQI